MSTLFASISTNIAAIQAQLPATVELIAISKGMPAEAVREAYATGVRHFGENRIQETEAKLAQLRDLKECVWHFIGHLQTNKVRKALQLFQYIDSVDSLKLARRIDRIAAELNRTVPICLQVKLAADPTKYGWEPEELTAAMSELLACKQVQFRGLMTILPQGLSPQRAIELFFNLKQLRDQLQAIDPARLSLSTLSMGMSKDFPLAVKAGATEVRVGSSNFRHENERESEQE
ncbi:MAG: YggS family pyridoxal phosphate-dependent enzyme [Cyanobacteria bacterium P01_E01_bin.34]